jgi:hypothetical protein
MSREHGWDHCLFVCMSLGEPTREGLGFRVPPSRYFSCQENMDGTIVFLSECLLENPRERV